MNPLRTAPYTHVPPTLSLLSSATAVPLIQRTRDVVMAEDDDLDFSNSCTTPGAKLSTEASHSRAGSVLEGQVRSWKGRFGLGRAASVGDRIGSDICMP
jgi:hypothetical protein